LLSIRQLCALPNIIIEEGRGVAREKTAMGKIGAVFEPELIELMKSALDGAATILPKVMQTSAMKVRRASRILAAPATGERDPIQLRIAALLEVVDDQEDQNITLAGLTLASIDLEQGYLQVQRLRKQVEKAEAANALHCVGSPRSLTKDDAIST
jgi:hypothetical protein